MINYTSLKTPCPTEFKNMQKYLQNFQNLKVFSRKTKIVQIPF